MPGAPVERMVLGRGKMVKFKVNEMMSYATQDPVVLSMVSAWSWSKVNVLVNKMVEYARAAHIGPGEAPTIDDLTFQWCSALRLPSLFQAGVGDEFEADRHQLWTDPRIMGREAYALRVYFAEVETVSSRSNCSSVEYAQFLGVGTLKVESSGQSWDIAVVHFLQVSCSSGVCLGLMNGHVCASRRLMQEKVDKGKNVGLGTTVYYPLYQLGVQRSRGAYIPYVNVVPVEAIVGQPVLLPRKSKWLGAGGEFWAAAHVSDSMDAPIPWPRLPDVSV